jgi:hypothetical protein
MTRSQLVIEIAALITDALNKQNTAARVREALGLLVYNLANLEEDGSAFDPENITTFLKLTGDANHKWVGKRSQHEAGNTNGIDSNVDFQEDYLRVMAGRILPSVIQSYLLLQRIAGSELAELGLSSPSGNNFIQLNPNFGYVGKVLRYLSEPTIANDLDITYKKWVVDLLAAIKGVANGYAPLNSSIKIDPDYLPDGWNPRIPMVGGRLFSYGDSFTQSVQATSLAHGYINIFSNANGMTLSNQSVSARGAYQAAINCITNFDLYSLHESTTLFGFNDVRRNGSAAATFNKINAAINVIAATSFTKFSIAASGVTSSGSWSNYTAITSRSVQKLGGNARYSSDAGNTLSYTTTEATNNIIIGCFGSDGIVVDYGRFTVKVDGVIKATYIANGQTDGVSDGVSPNTIMPNVLIIDGLPSSIHTVLITLLDSKVTPIDYVGYMRQPSQCQGVLVGSIPRMNAAGYAISPSLANNTVIDAAKVSMRNNISAFSQYGRNVLFIDVDKYYIPTTCVGVDLIHPNDFGFQRLAQAFQSGIQSSVNFKGEIFTLSSTVSQAVPSYFSAYYDRFSKSFLQLAVNRNPNTGVFFDPSKSSSQISLQSDNNSGEILMFTSSVNNVQSVLALKIDKTGATIMGPLGESNVKLTNSGDDLSVLAMFDGNTIIGLNQGLCVANNSVLNFWKGNGTNRIARAAIYSFSTSDVAGSEDGCLAFYTKPTSNNYLLAMTIDQNQNVGIGIISPTAKLQLKAGTATANTAPIKLTTAGAALNTIPEAGAFETDGTDLYFTNNAGVRKKVTIT